jgi:pimeloyl-ACP methyl ester carboxylesterase
VADAFRRADRRGMQAAIGWLSPGRPDLTPMLDRLQVPTLLSTGEHDPMWTVGSARVLSASDTMPMAARSPNGCTSPAPPDRSPAGPVIEGVVRPSGAGWGGRCRRGVGRREGGGTSAAC